MLKLIPILLLSWLGLSACMQEPEGALKLATNVWPGYELFHLADELGYYQGQPIDLVQLITSAQSMEAYRNGLVDAAALTMDEVLHLLDSGEEPVVVQVIDVSDGGDAILARPGFTSLQDLRGRRIGVESSAVGAYMFLRAMQTAGMRPSEVTVVDLEVQEHFTAFMKGSVDAVVTFEPVISQLKAQPSNLLFDSSQIPNEIVDVLVIRRESLPAHTETIRALVTGWYQAAEYLARQPAEAGSILGAFMNLPADEAIAAFAGLRLPDQAENQRLVQQEPPELLTSVQKMVSSMQQTRLLSRELDIRQLFAPELLQ